MKKKYFLLLGVLLTATGCKGKEITMSEALNVLNNIAIESVKEYKSDTLSFTFEYDYKVNGEVRVQEYLKYDGITDNIYTEGIGKHGGFEYYAGIINEDYYNIDPNSKKYTCVKGEVGLATYYLNHSSQILKPAMMCNDVVNKMINFINDKDYNCTYYSSGAGNIYMEYNNDRTTNEYECKIENNRLVSVHYIEVDKYNNKIESYTKIKYRANVKLPSLDKYETKNLIS